MAAIPGLEFEAYFQAIADNFGRSSNFYTLTDTEHKPHFYDMGLMVQTPQPKKPDKMPFAEKQNVETRNLSQRVAEVPSVVASGVASLPVLDGIRKYANEHVLLVGKPGSGKSTALEQLLLEEAKLCLKAEKRKIPVLIELRSWRTSVVDLIQKFFRRHKLRLSTDNIDDLLSEKQLFLLFDGLNELPSDEARREVADFRENNPEIPMIFTTRDLGVGGDLGIKKQLEMQPLTEQQMRSFVRAYLPQQGDEMLRQLNDRLRELGQTPLILKMLCEVFDYAKQVPKSRGALFHYFDREFDKLKGVVPVAEGLGHWKPELLQHLAFVMMQGENPNEKPTDFRLSISRGKAEAVLEDFLKDRVDSPGQKAKDWLQDLLKHYLIQTGADREQVEFHHQLFQEYYAAEYLRKLLPSLNDRKLKRDYLNLLKWTEPLALMLGLVEDEAQAVRVVQLALNVDLMLGARLAGEVKSQWQVKCIGLITDLGLPQLLEIKLLVISKSESAISMLIQAIKEKDSSIYRYAVAALQEIPSNETTLIRFLQDQDFNIRSCAAYALGSIGSDIVIPNLIQALQDENSSVRSSAASALGGTDSDIAVTALIQALQDENSSVRNSAVSTLGEIGSDEAICGVIKAIQDKDSSVRSSAASALGGSDSDIAVTALIQALQDEDSSVRNSAVSALGEIGSDEAISGVIKAIEDEDSSVRTSVISVLENTDHNVENSVLIEGLQNQDDLVRDYALSTLREREFDDEVILDVLNEAIENAPKNVQEVLKEIYEEIREEVEYEYGKIRWGLDTPQYQESQISLDATNVLQDIRSTSKISEIIQYLKNTDYRIICNAIEDLKKIDDEAAMPVLIKALQDNFFVQSDSGNNFPFVLLSLNKIQRRYKFYNYEIFHYPLVEENKTELKSSNSPNTSYIIQGNVGILNAGNVTNQGNQVGEQYNK